MMNEVLNRNNYFYMVFDQKILSGRSKFLDVRYKI